MSNGVPSQVAGVRRSTAGGPDSEVAAIVARADHAGAGGATSMTRPRALRKVNARAGRVHGVAALVQQPVVATTQQHQVVEAGRAAVRPVHHVVRVAAACRAAGKPASPCPAPASARRIAGGTVRVLRPTSRVARAVRSLLHHPHDRARRRTRRAPTFPRKRPDRRVVRRLPGTVECDVGHVGRWGRRGGVHVQHHLIAVSGRAAVEPAGQGRFGQPAPARRPAAAPASPRPTHRAPAPPPHAIRATSWSAAASSARCTTAPCSGVRRPCTTSIPSSST